MWRFKLTKYILYIIIWSMYLQSQHIYKYARFHYQQQFTLTFVSNNYIRQHLLKALHSHNLDTPHSQAK